MKPANQYDDLLANLRSASGHPPFVNDFAVRAIEALQARAVTAEARVARAEVVIEAADAMRFNPVHKDYYDKAREVYRRNISSKNERKTRETS